jgi:hypothetical protein
MELYARTVSRSCVLSSQNYGADAIILVAQLESFDQAESHGLVEGIKSAQNSSFQRQLKQYERWPETHCSGRLMTIITTAPSNVTLSSLKPRAP